MLRFLKAASRAIFRALLAQLVEHLTLNHNSKNEEKNHRLNPLIMRVEPFLKAKREHLILSEN